METLEFHSNFKTTPLSITDIKLTSQDDLTLLARNQGVDTWLDLLNHVRHLPYGRNKDRSDFSLVLKEGKGSCSSKHALLQMIADRNHIPNVSLILGIYKMHKGNTPAIGNTLDDTPLAFVPEAHCYLDINGQMTDLTSPSANYDRIAEEVMYETIIVPEQVVTHKVKIHQDYLHKWIKESECHLSFEQVWAIREQCIAQLSAV